MPTRTAVRVAVLVASAIGAAACLLAIVATYWGATGTTPAWVYERFGALPGLRSGIYVAGVPIESWGLLCFASIALMQLAGDRAPHGLSVVSSFAIGILLAGVSAVLAWSRSLRTWTMDIVVVASAAVILAVSFERFPAPPGVWRSLMARPPALQRIRGGCTLLAGVFVLFGISAFSLRLAIHAVPPTQAATANFLNWYSSRAPLPDPGLFAEGCVRIVAFIDYQCPFSASVVPKIQTLVDRLSESSPVPIEFVIYDFPLDALCNAGLRKSLHEGACEAAAALRFVKLNGGNDAESELARWLYERNANITSGLIRGYLTARGVYEQFERQRMEMLHLVSADVGYGLRLGVRATPSFFVNGVRMPSAGLVETAVRFELTGRSGR